VRVDSAKTSISFENPWTRTQHERQWVGSSPCVTTVLRSDWHNQGCRDHRTICDNDTRYLFNQIKAPVLFMLSPRWRKSSERTGLRRMKLENTDCVDWHQLFLIGNKRANESVPSNSQTNILREVFWNKHEPLTVSVK